MQRQEELIELVDFLTEYMIKKDLRFGQFISNLESKGMNFDDEFYTENKHLMEKIKEMI